MPRNQFHTSLTHAEILERARFVFLYQQTAMTQFENSATFRAFAYIGVGMLSALLLIAAYVEDFCEKDVKIGQIDTKFRFRSSKIVEFV